MIVIYLALIALFVLAAIAAWRGKIGAVVHELAISPKESKVK